MRQELTALLEPNTEDEFDLFDSYYSSVSDYSQMDVIKTLIEDVSHPVFIVKSNTRKVLAVNKCARKGITSHSVVNSPFDALLSVTDEVIVGQPITFFDDTWYNVSERTFLLHNEVYLSITLTPRPEAPDERMLANWKHMIALMLHRFRSPITGISGYLDLLKEESTDNQVNKRVDKIDFGVAQLIDMMDELETLYHIPTNFDQTKLEPTDVAALIYKVCINLPEEQRKRINFLQKSDPVPFRATSDSLERVLSLLIQNAIEHSEGADSSVSISLLSDKYIKISNESSGIPEDIRTHLFHPFVTSKANNLGIGLTMALLFAQQFGGTIFQTENGENNRVSFTICFP